MTYREWIDQYARTQNQQLLGKCRAACLAMQEAFPELRVVRGHVDTDWGRRGHWWLQDEAGGIVDPTARQFNIIVSYEPWEPGATVRVGRCMDCGLDIWRSVEALDQEYRENFCNKKCHDSFGASLL